RALRHLGQEFRELVGARGQLPGLCEHGGLACEDFGEMRADHSGARTRRHDHVAAFLELRDHSFGERTRRFPIAGVPAGLPAAGLHRRHGHLVSGVLQEFQRGKCDRRPHEIHKAGYEQADAHEIRENGLTGGAEIIARGAERLGGARSTSWFRIASFDNQTTRWPTPNPSPPASSSTSIPICGKAISWTRSTSLTVRTSVSGRSSSTTGARTTRSSCIRSTRSARRGTPLTGILIST